MDSNFLKIKYPNLFRDWDDSKNQGLNKDKITVGSSKIIIDWKCCKCGFEWRQKVLNRVKFQTQCRICSNENTLLSKKFPDLFNEIDIEKNDGLNVNTITIGSSKKIWWRCEKGHSWFQNVDTRVKLGSSCKECKNYKNSIVITHPHLMLEWDSQKNKLINPESLTKGSNKKVWWICINCKNSFQCVVDRRTRGTNCNNCRKRVKTKIPLTENHKYLLEEWDYDENKSYLPGDISEGSNIKIYWKCKEGHSFQMQPYQRTKQGLGCPYCRGLKINNSNSLLSLRPDLCKQWDYEKNTRINPNKISIGSNKIVWWKCEKGHSWESYIYNRTKKNGTNCPMCSGRVSSTEDNLKVNYPHLLNEWDWEKNKISPQNIRPGSHKKVWWKCEKGHSWETNVYSRVGGDFGCPFCSGRYTTKEDSIGYINPSFMKEWDWEKNKSHDPFTLPPKSEKKVWWRCLNDKKHLWKTTISHRTSGTGCPYCSFTKIIVSRYINKFKLVKTDRITLYYLVFYNEQEVFYKIGITKNTVEERYKNLFEKTGYKVIKVRIIKNRLEEIVNMEQTIHRKVSRNLDTKLIKYKPNKYFGGISECYHIPNGLLKYENLIKQNYNNNSNIISIYQILKQ